MMSNPLSLVVDGGDSEVVEFSQSFQGDPG